MKVDAKGESLWVNDQGVYIPVEEGIFDYPSQVFLTDDDEYYIVSNFWDAVTFTDRFDEMIDVFGPVWTYDTGGTIYQSWVIARYSSKGELLWAKNTFADDVNHRAVTFAFGAALMNGTDLVLPGLSVEGSVTFGVDEPTEILVEEPGQFIAAYQSDGSLKWLEYFEDTFVSFGAGVQTDTEELFFAGMFKGELELEDGTVVEGEGDDGEFLLYRMSEF